MLHVKKEEKNELDNGIRTIYFMGVKMSDTKGSTKHQHIVIPGPMKVLQKTLTQSSIDRRDKRVTENKQTM